MAKSWYQACKDALEMYRNRDKYVFFYGAKGQVLTTAAMDALWNAEPNYFKQYSAEQKQQIYRNSLNKIGYDCSGFICKVTGENGYSTSIYEKRSKETTIAEGLAGQFLYTTWNGNGRHIGIDAGFGFAIDMLYESTDENIRLHKDSVRLTKISDTSWEHSFQTAAINYNASYSIDPNESAPVEQPQPQPQPQPSASTSIIGEATTDVNLRTGPGVTHQTCNIDRNDGRGVRCYLKKGEVVEIIGESDGWYQTNIAGKIYTWQPWVSKKYIKIL